MDPRSHTVLFRRALTIGALLLALACTLGACNRGQVAVPTSPATKTITSNDGALQLTVPGSWSQQSDLNEVAALQAGDRSREAYGVVIEDPRRAFASMDLERFSEQEMQKLVTRVGLANLSGPEELEVDGKNALQYRLKGFHNSVEVVYLYTFVETPDRFLKVVTWSLASNFERNRRVLEQVASSVRELKPLAEPTQPAAGPQQQDPAQLPGPRDPAGIDRGVGPPT